MCVRCGAGSRRSSAFTLQAEDSVAAPAPEMVIMEDVRDILCVAEAVMGFLASCRLPSRAWWSPWGFRRRLRAALKEGRGALGRSGLPLHPPPPPTLRCTTCSYKAPRGECLPDSEMRELRHRLCSHR